jgi:tetratricopeptide (TPR) repeat protein
MRRSRPHVSGAVLAAVLLLALCEAPPHAREPARWIELRTPHFTVVSNGPEDDARRLARELERVRAWLQRAHTNARFDSGEPVIVLAVGDENGLRELLPQFWERKGQRPVAAYWRGPYRQCIALRIDAPEHERYRRILHEYVHLLTHATFPDLPVWLDEGVSEFWATAIAADDAVEVGRPAPQNLRVLRTRHPWIPLDQLLAMERIPDAGNKDKLSLFYAQSWALVHYLMLGGPSVNLDLVPAAHLAASPQLESAVAAYASGGRFRAIRLEVPATAISGDQNESMGYRLRALTPAASLAVRAGCLAEGERPLAALPLLARAIAESSADASVLETLGYVHFQQNEPAEAARWFDRAIESGSAGHLAYFYRAILATPVPNRADGQPVLADQYLRMSIDLSKSFAPAYSRLAAVYAGEDARSDEALALLVRTTELDPEDPAYWVDLGRFLSGMNRTVEARQAGESGLAVARSAGARRLVEAFLNEIPR